MSYVNTRVPFALKIMTTKEYSAHIHKHTMSYVLPPIRWQELVALTGERKELLKGAEQVHKFIRDASETNDRMNEKVSMAQYPPQYLPFLYIITAVHYYMSLRH